MPTQIPTFATAAALARRAGVHRMVVVRLVAQNVIAPDALLELGTAEPQPLFRNDRAAEVLRAARPAKH
jgi:hypothetical protein